jgi:hypothetical protein
VMTMLALSALCSGCVDLRDAPRPAAVSPQDAIELQVDDLLVDLPEATLVTCLAKGDGRFVYTWSGSGAVVPRHPWDEDGRATRVRLRFDSDPLEATEVSLRLYQSGSMQELLWSSASADSATAPSLTRIGRHGYRLTGSVAEADSHTPSHPVYVEFHC